MKANKHMILMQLIEDYADAVSNYEYTERELGANNAKRK